MQGREGGTCTVVLGALGHPTRCGGTAAPAQGAFSHQQGDLKPGNKALGKANLWEEDGGNTLQEIDGVEPYHCMHQNNSVCVSIYIYDKLNGNKQLGQDLGGAMTPPREHSSY